MNTVNIERQTEVEAFLTEVRGRLTDLTDEQRDDLLGGLEADLMDQVADGSDLGDPVTYAAELRAAAGLPPLAQRKRSRQPLRPQDVSDALDEARRRFTDLRTSHAWAMTTGDLLTSLRPAWWALRGWIVATMIDIVAGDWEYVTVVPTLLVPGLGMAVLLACIALSALLGMGRLRIRGGVGAPLGTRLTMLGINVAALAMIPIISGHTAGSGVASNGNDFIAGWDEGYFQAHQEGGLRQGGEPVRNIFAFDENGLPLSGVQLYRANGKPLSIAPQETSRGSGPDRTVGCGWLNGSTQRFNVFPLLQRQQRGGTCLTDRPHSGPVTVADPPFAQAPAVTSPLVATGVTPDDPAATASPAPTTAPTADASTPVKPRAGQPAQP